MTNNNITKQMELTISSNNPHRQNDRGAATGSQHRPCGSHRAAWWFDKMRQTVDNATAWSAQSSLNH
jgi:hypothetical protein